MNENNNKNYQIIYFYFSLFIFFYYNFPLLGVYYSIKNNIEKKSNEALRHPFFTELFDPNSAMTVNKDLNVLK